MVAYKISYNDVLTLLKLEDGTSVDQLDELFSYAKCEIEEHDLDDDLIKVDCKTSNRPDLWGVEGLTREVKGILDLEVGLPATDAEPSGYVVEVDPNILKIRPYIACSIVRGLTFTDFLIKQLMQLQEKVDFSYGRKRKRSSIGIYNIEMVKSPIKYELTSRKTKFIPLGYTKELTLDEILEVHEKGIEYKEILPKKGPLPILRDTTGTVLSMPPIINSNDVGRVNEETTDVLVEVTGTNFEVVQVVNALVTQALRDRGGKVYSVEVHYPPNHGDAPELLVTPRAEPYEINVDPKQIESFLDLNLKVNDIIKLLAKRRFECIKKKKSLLVKYPPYRVDLLHTVDVAEEVAIAYGYMKIKPSQNKVITIGSLSSRTKSENYVREILSGCSLQEVLTFTLISPDKLSTLMNKDESELNRCIQVKNPVSINYSVMRHRLLPGLLDFLSKNTHNEYPQYLFEIGETVVLEGHTAVKTVTKTAVLLAGNDVSFELAHSILQALCRGLNVDYTLKPAINSELIPGRTADIEINGKIVGTIGEINPEILQNWEIIMPSAAFEVDLSMIPTLDLAPLYTFNPK
ncbi:MAG: phenylalanine--tRNA ligase subunit beta [Candidatus Hodarchaeales archaeon]